MGTKVQCKNYLPGYFMGDLNEDADAGSWSHLYEDKVFKTAPFYNGFPQGHLDGYLDFNKEAVKQTMLHHEAIFRKQVSELHELYRIQRDLMDEIQRKEAGKYSVSTVTMQSCPFSSQAPSEDTQKIWKRPSFVNSNCYGPSFSGTNNRGSLLNFLKENTNHADSSLTRNENSLNDCDLLDPTHKKLPKRTFDLQLPADEYIDSEDEGGVGDEKAHEISLGTRYSFNYNRGVEPERNLKLTLGVSRTLSIAGDNRKLDSHIQDSLDSRFLADLNEPIHGICNEEVEASASIDFISSTVNHGQHPTVKPSLSILGRPRDCFQDNQKGRDHRTLPDILHVGNDGVRRALSFNSEPGQSRSATNSFISAFGHDKSTTSSESTQFELKKAHELPPFLLFDQRKKETWSGEKGTYGVDISKRTCSLTGSNYPGPPISSSYPAIPQANDNNTASPSVSSWRKPLHSVTQSPVVVQALPCFNVSAALDVPGKSSNTAIHSIGDTGENWYHNGNSRSYTSCGSEVAYQNGFNHPFQPESNESSLQFPLVGFNKLNPDHHNTSSYEHIEDHDPRKYFKDLDFRDVKPAKDIRLNSCAPNDFNDRVNHHQDHVCIDGKTKPGGASGGLSWLGTKVACNESMDTRGSSTQIDLGFLSGYSQLRPAREAEIQKYENETRTEQGPPANFVPIFGSALHSKDVEAHRVEMIDSPSSKNILNFPVLEKPHITKDQGALGSPCMSTNGIGTSVKDGLLHFDLSCKLTLPDSGRKLFMENPGHKMGIGNSCAGFRGDINLNSAAEAYNEQPKSLENLYKSDTEVPKSSSIPRTTAKIRIEIDLEAPVIPEGVEDIVHGTQPPQTNEVVTPVHPSQFKTENAQEALARMAAEVIMTMSSVVTNHFEKPNTMSSVVSNHLQKPECCLSSTALSESLQWFAEVVSLNASDPESIIEVSKGKCSATQGDSDGGSDFFEEMTLKLSETNVEEHCFKNLELENQRMEGTDTCPLLTRPRRGQARRGRQRRDFQRDILPGLASLSRHEVTEDLQTIGGLLRASGCSWQTGLTRRNAGRNGWNGQARGRRRSRGSASAGARNLTTSPTQPTNSEMELEGISLQGWGKTTRRCQRQRCPTGNAAALLT